tara:strand:+ start:1189 stop:1404 length:216 start_codon:yes stop_codon:yes gene_type:complete
MSGTRKQIEICYDVPTGRTTLTSWTDVDTECYWTLLEEVENMLDDDKRILLEVNSVSIDGDEVFPEFDWEM